MIGFIHSRIYTAPLQGNYSEVLPTPAWSKRTVCNWFHTEYTDWEGCNVMQRHTLKLIPMRRKV